MYIHGKRHKDGQNYKTSMYEFEKSIFIRFEEKKTKDVVDIVLELSEKERGFYSEEFRPESIKSDEAKANDITAFKVNDESKEVKYLILDVKKDVGGEDVIEHLCEQWNSGYKYLYNSYINYLDDYSVDGNIGVVTRHFDEDRISNQIEKKKELIDNCSKISNTIAGAKYRSEIPKLKKQIEWLELFLNKKVRIKYLGKEKIYVFAVFRSKEDEKGEWYGKVIL